MFLVQHHPALLRSGRSAIFPRASVLKDIALLRSPKVGFFLGL